jgi:hypothetical protein
LPGIKLPVNGGCGNRCHGKHSWLVQFKAA